MDFKVGDIVSLKSGGPNMTVNGANDRDAAVVYLNEKTGRFEYEQFEHCLLVAVCEEK